MRSLSTAVLLAVVVPILWPATARAEVTIRVEDFDEDGEPGFDPMFGHFFFQDDGAPHWAIIDNVIGKPDDFVLFLGGCTKDWVTFPLGPAQSVEYASVEVFNGAGVGGTTVTFVGTNANLTFTDKSLTGFRTFTASSDDIGDILSIQLWSYEGFFDNVTIRVIPEPSAVATLIVMAAFFTVANLLVSHCRLIKSMSA